MSELYTTALLVHLLFLQRTTSYIMFHVWFDIVLINKKFPAPKSVYQPGLVPSEMCMVPMMQCALMQPMASWMLVFEQ